MITDIVHGRRIGLRDPFGKNGAGTRGVAERARAREHVCEGIARGLDFEPLSLSRGNRDIQVIRVGGHSFHRALSAPELAADDAHAGAVIVGDLGYRTRRNVLIARVDHLQR